MKRRNFIILSTTAALAAGSSYWYIKHFSNGLDNTIASPQFLSLIMDTQTINMIGKNYRKRFPNEDDESSLLKLLTTKTSNESSDVSVLKKEINEDFETGNIIIINGWILSYTEARQCALFSLKIS